MAGTEQQPKPAESNGSSKKYNPGENERLRLLADIVTNATLMRDGLISKLIDPRRDIDYEAGYPKSLDVTPDQYRTLYDRDPIAARVVQLMPKECWGVQPEVYEDDDEGVETEFEQAWKELPTQLRGQQSWYKGNEGNPIWDQLQRLNVVSGIGHFGAMLIGIDDGKMLDQPADGVATTQPMTVRNAEGIEEVRTIERLVVNGELGPISQPKYVPHKIRIYDDCAPVPFRKACENRASIEYTAKELDAKARRLTANQAHEEIALHNAYRDISDGKGFQDSQSSNPDDGAAFPYGNLGTDAQYMGVQLGPSEYPSQQPAQESRKLLFLRSYDESLVQIVQYEANMRNPRFGLPVMYLIQLNDPRDQSNYSGIGLPLATVRVHWSRVIHVPSDEQVNSEVIGAPRMRNALNPILDCYKIRAAGAEGYWRSGLGTLVLSTHPTLGGDVVLDQANVRTQMENVQNSIQRVLALTGMSAQMIGPSVLDPGSQIQIQMQVICIVKAVPLRIFQGAERGQLASSQDDESWNERKAGYQNGFITPRIIVVFVDRLISMGVLPVPAQVLVKWPDLEALNAQQKASLAQQRTGTIASYLASGVENLIPPMQFLTKILGWTQAEAQSVVDAAQQLEDSGEMEPSPVQARLLMAGLGVSQGIQQLVQAYASGQMPREVIEMILANYLLMTDDDIATLLDSVPQGGGQPQQPGTEGGQPQGMQQGGDGQQPSPPEQGQQQPQEEEQQPTEQNEEHDESTDEEFVPQVPGLQDEQKQGEELVGEEEEQQSVATVPYPDAMPSPYAAWRR